MYPRNEGKEVARPLNERNGLLDRRHAAQPVRNLSL